jgi:uncharacterized spore protein YtfJ
MLELDGYRSVLDKVSQETRISAVDENWFTSAGGSRLAGAPGLLRKESSTQLMASWSMGYGLAAAAASGGEQRRSGSKASDGGGGSGGDGDAATAAAAAALMVQWGGMEVLPARPGCTLQGMVVAAKSIVRFFRNTARPDTGFLEVFQIQTREKWSHEISEPAAIVTCQHDLPALHLTSTSVLAFVTQTSRRDLVDELIMFENAGP